MSGGRGRRYGPIALALALDLVGAAGALLIATRHWQTITTPRPAPRRDDILQITGRTVDSAPTALALVALAGVVAVLATRGLVRRVVGGVLVLAGAGLIVRSITAAGSMSATRARSLVRARHVTVDLTGVTPHVSTSPVWPVLSVVGGVLVLVAGVLIAWRGHRWLAMSARYEAPADPARDQARASTTMWSALDRGEDPTDAH
jgi:uncharacterized membrane protein (TIGR02234 family)